MNVDFGTNKTPVEIIREGAFGGTCLRDIYSGVNDKWYKKSWKEFDELKKIVIRIIIVQIILILMLINIKLIKLSVEHH